MLLFLVFKRQDTKFIAKTLLEKFGSIHGILNASEKEVLSVKGIGPNAYRIFQTIKIVINSVLQSRITNKPIIECFEDVINYCQTNMKALN